MFRYLVNVYRGELAKCPHKNPLRVWVETAVNKNGVVVLYSEVGACVGTCSTGEYGLPTADGKHIVKRWIEISR